MLALTISDVVIPATGTAYLHLAETKAGHAAEQVLPDWCAAELAAYLKHRRQETKSGDAPLLTHYRGIGQQPTNKPIPDRTARRLFKKLLGETGIGASFSPHAARATAITKLLSDQMPYRAVQEFSRHATVQMVEKYDKRAFGRENAPGRGLKY